MKQSAVRTTAAVSFLALTLSSVGAYGENYLELAYSEVNPDWKPYSNGSGVRVLGEYRLMPRLFLFGSYNSAELRTSGPDLSHYRTADDWKIAGTAMDFPLNDMFRVHGGASWQGVKLGGNSKNGYGIHGGISVNPAKWLELNLDVAYVDLVVNDIALSADLALRLHKHAAVTLRIHDHSDWDFTAYEAGLRIYF